MSKGLLTIRTTDNGAKIHDPLPIAATSRWLGGFVHDRQHINFSGLRRGESVQAFAPKTALAEFLLMQPGASRAWATTWLATQEEWSA